MWVEMWLEMMWYRDVSIDICYSGKLDMERVVSWISGLPSFD